MSLLAHAITASPAEPIAVSGLRGRPIERLETSGLGLWTTRWENGEPLGRDDMLEHHRVVERICGATPCLPIRFGTAFADAAAARAALDRRQGSLREALARVAGRSEIAVTLLWREQGTPRPTDPAERSTPAPGGQASSGAAPEADPAAGPGRRFMEARRARWASSGARRERAQELAGRLIAVLAVEPAFVWHEICSSEPVAVSLALLTPAEQALERMAFVRGWAESLADVTAVVNGPWPPYTFARID